MVNQAHSILNVPRDCFASGTLRESSETPQGNERQHDQGVTMKVTSSLIELIGNTPLVDISSIVPAGGAKLFAKLEYLNPGGSIKDRPALAMIEAAERDGRLEPGMTIVEPTAGNTGIGLALAGNLKGYRTVFFVPDRMSHEKIVLMQLYGAEVFLVDKCHGMTGCIERAHAYAAQHGRCFVPLQFENPANPEQAETRLGAEIEQQLGYVPDGMAIGAGTGGTFTGLARWLSNANPDSVRWLVQPEGSVFRGDEKRPYLVEGIGNSFVPKNLDLHLAHRILDIPCTVAFARCRDLARRLGILTGGSGGANAEAAIQLCTQLGEGKSVITVFPDNLERYASKEWVRNLVQGEN
ncbi:PLP-dependent cysteine synthase family protein [Acanthopleuribacter pedis]|uniref:Cysteine synthase n=1 Tax=Acanthopleuribacter pedis TaxID=442870 RepID=A0A8J7U7W9_9BACT|nr:PLP-dependent cysteine synthase family protein [Acanthopleuribacter pedis]MBO1322963.1 PLP-dependent cysteine synthase family protein [Acanthopleuribacter pedis]